MKHLISLSQWSAEDIRQCLDLATEMIAAPGTFAAEMSNRTLAMLFQKTSTRTRASFAAAMHQLGGSFVELDWAKSSFVLGSIDDETRCLSRYADLIMARLKLHEDIVHMANASTVPVINGCCNKYHPCQVLADLLTIQQRFERLEGLRLTYVGTFNNMANSLLLGCIPMGMEVTLVTPGQRPDAVDEEALRKAEASGRLRQTLDVRDGVRGADVVYTDTWVDMDLFNDPDYQAEKNRLLKEFGPYQINQETLAEAPRAIVMHCLAAHRGYEITGDVLEGPQSVVFDQAENRLHAQKAIMLMCLGAV
jgi:ornithine carbamoyltransferase